MEEEHTGGESEMPCSDVPRLEDMQQLAFDVLERLNHSVSSKDAIRDILEMVKKRADFEAVGIRLREGDDFPYYEVRGFRATFVEAEQYLCSRNVAGEVIRDANGEPVLECMCGNVLCGRFDPTEPFFTPNGSFWTNCTTELLESTSGGNRLGRTRNRCNREGYESVALIPLRRGCEVIGLLQLNDHRKGMFTQDVMSFFEKLGASIGIAVACIRAETAAKNNAAYYRALFDGAVDGIALADAETGRLIDCNLALCRLVEREPTELIGQAQTILHPAQDLIDGKSPCFLQHLRGENGPILDENLLTKSDALIPVEIRAARIRLDEHDYLLGTFRDITERKRAEDASRESAASLRALAARLQVIREEERTALSRELHDEFGQNLTALQIDLEWVGRHMRDDSPLDVSPIQNKIKAMVPLVSRLIESTQAACASLRPGILEELGLPAAIEWQAEDCQKRTDLTCTIAIPDDDIALDPGLSLALFRILQESLTNVACHAQATRVDIKLHVAAGEVHLEVQDNGQGFAQESLSDLRSLGLLSMRERAAAFGGTVDLLSELGKGTTVRVRMPTILGAT